VWERERALTLSRRKKDIGKTKKISREQTQILIQLTPAWSARVQHADHTKYFWVRLSKTRMYRVLSTECLFLFVYFLRFTLTSGSAAETAWFIRLQNDDTTPETWKEKWTIAKKHGMYALVHFQNCSPGWILAGARYRAGVDASWGEKSGTDTDCADCEDKKNHVCHNDLELERETEMSDFDLTSIHANLMMDQTKVYDTSPQSLCYPPPTEGPATVSGLRRWVHGELECSDRFRTPYRLHGPGDRGHANPSRLEANRANRFSGLVLWYISWSINDDHGER